MTVLASPSVVALGWVGLPAFVGFVLWYGRRKREELAHLVDLQRQLVTAD
jgi:LPXTG-motif cell wall-anchored protein